MSTTVKLVPKPLLDVFPAETGRRLAVIGAGGKSTTIGRIAELEIYRNPPVAVTTTTKMQADQAVGPILSASDKPWRDPPMVFTMGEVLTSDGRPRKLSSPNREAVTELLEKFPGRVLIEADGARQSRLKLHRDFEPVIPRPIDALVSFFDLSVVEATANEENVHAIKVWEEWYPDERTVTPEIIEDIFNRDHGYQSPNQAEHWLTMTHPGGTRQRVVENLESFSQDFWNRFDRVILLQNHNIFRVHIE